MATTKATGTTGPAARRAASPARVKQLYVATEQGHAGVLAKESQHLFSYAPEVLEPLQPQCAISLTMPPRATPWMSTPMLSAFQTFLPEGYLKERIIERFAKTMKVDDMALLAFSGANPIGRLRLCASREGAPLASTRENLAEILAHEGTQDLFEYLCDKYLVASGISGVQPKVMLSVDAQAPDAAAPGGAAGMTPGTAPGMTPGLVNTAGPGHAAPAPKGSLLEKASLRARQLIVKAAGPDYPDLPANEFHCLSIARACGPALIEVPAFQLSADRRRLVIERFDLDGAGGHYLGFEDMVSLQGKTNEDKYQGSYENIALAVRNNCSPAHTQDSLRRLYVLVALSVILRNGDAHLKNFGILYTDPASEDARLGPAYDLVTTTAYLPADKLALKLAGSKSWPDRATLAAFGRDQCGVRDAESIIDTLRDAALAYRPALDDGQWRKQRALIEKAAGSVAAPRHYQG